MCEKFTPSANKTVLNCSMIYRRVLAVLCYRSPDLWVDTAVGVYYTTVRQVVIVIAVLLLHNLLLLQQQRVLHPGLLGILPSTEAELLLIIHTDLTDANIATHLQLNIEKVCSVREVTPMVAINSCCNNLSCCGTAPCSVQDMLAQCLNFTLYFNSRLGTPC